MDDWSEKAKPRSATATVTPEHTTGGRRGAPTTVGDYQLRQRISRRPNADVLLATHVPSGEPRDLYVLRPAAMQDRALVARAAAEAELARTLAHPVLPPVDVPGTSSDGRMYVAVQHREGVSLAHAVAASGALARQRVADVASQLADALDRAHHRGLVHGRIAPTSVLLGARDASGRENVTLTGIGTSAADAGEPSPDELAFTSPEQMWGARADVRSDVFAFASVLWYAIEGTAPRGIGSTPARGTPAPLRPGALDVLAAARAADPAHRPASIRLLHDEFIGALRAEASAERAKSGAAPSLDDVVGLLRLRDRPRPADVMLGGLDPFASAAPSIAPVAAIAPADREPTMEMPVASAIHRLRLAEILPGMDWRAIFARPRTRQALAGVAAAALVLALVPPMARAAFRRPSADAGASVRSDALRLVTSPPAKSTGSVAPASGFVPFTITPTPKPKLTLVRGGAPKSDVAETPPAADHRAPKLAIPVLEIAVPDQPSVGRVVTKQDFAVAPAPSTTPPDDGLAATVATRQDAQRAVDAFARALEKRDIAALQRAYPGLTASERDYWTKVFRGARQVAADLSVGDVQRSGEVIVASVSGRIGVRASDAMDETASRVSFATTIKRDSTGWRMRSMP